MKIAITGATGFIGKRLIELSTELGNSFVALSRDNYKAEAMEGVDAIVHLAGEPVAQRWSPEVKDRILRSRVEGTGNLVDAIGKMERKPKVLVCASAIGFYGARRNEVMVETSSPGSGYLPDVCVAWEGAADRAAQLGVRVVKLRIGMVLGRGGGALQTMETPFKLGVGGTLGSGKQWMSWVHLDDIVRLIQFAISTESMAGPVNATAPNPVMNADFTRLYAAALHRPAFFPVPEMALHLLYGEMSQVILSSQRILPAVAERMGFQFRYPDLALALKEIYG